MPSRLFGANLHNDLTSYSELRICQHQFSFKACHDLFSSGEDTQEEVLPGNTSQGR